MSTTMKLPFRLPVLPSQCTSPTSGSDHGQQHTIDVRHGHDLSSSAGGEGRQPLQESTGNAQYNIFAALRSSYPQRVDGLASLSSSIPHGIPAPPMVPTLPTQALGSTRYESAYAMSLQHQRSRLQLNQRRRRRAINPISLSPQYQNYRKRQKDKEDQKWPDTLEDAFLDGKTPGRPPPFPGSCKARPRGASRETNEGWLTLAWE